MPAARYWRVVGISTYGGGDLELSDIALYSGGTRVDGSATFTSTFAPISAGRWAAADVRQPGFALQWDFGVAQDVDDVQFTPTTAPGGPGFWETHYSETGSEWSCLRKGWARWEGSPPTNTSGGAPDFKRVGFFTNSMYDGDVSDRSLIAAGFFDSGYDLVKAPNIRYVSPNTGLYFTTQFLIQDDFTLETYLGGGIGNSAIQPANISARVLLNANLSVRIRYYTNSDNRVEITDQTGVVVATESSGWTPNTMRHVAWTRSGSTNTLWVNGQSRATWNDSSDILVDRVHMTCVSKTPAVFGPTRIELGVCKYTAAFAPPAASSFLSETTPPLKPSVVSAFPQPPTRISEYTPPATVTSKLAEPPNRIDIAYGGTAIVTGTVKRKADPANVPLRRRVRLYDEIGRQFIREVWSDAVTGEFVFENLNPAYPYTVITYDYENNYRALTVDKVVAV